MRCRQEQLPRFSPRQVRSGQDRHPDSEHHARCGERSVAHGRHLDHQRKRVELGAIGVWNVGEPFRARDACSCWCVGGPGARRTFLSLIDTSCRQLGPSPGVCSIAVGPSQRAVRELALGCVGQNTDERAKRIALSSRQPIRRTTWWRAEEPSGLLPSCHQPERLRAWSAAWAMPPASCPWSWPLRSHPTQRRWPCCRA